MKLKQQRALEEKEVFEKYGLPIIETTTDSLEEIFEKYDRVVKDLGKEKRTLSNKINRMPENQ